MECYYHKEMLEAIAENDKKRIEKILSIDPSLQALIKPKTNEVPEPA
jgi:hypothetical protein